MTDRLCEHIPRCLQQAPDYCWPDEFVSTLAHHMRSAALDPVQVEQRLGRPGLAIRVREYLDRWFAERRGCTSG